MVEATPAEAATRRRFSLPDISFRTRIAVLVGLFTLLVSPAAVGPLGAQDDSADESEWREITFPVVGPVNFVDTWGACRGANCSRSHKGVDVFGAKLAPLVAAADGVIIHERRSDDGLGGNSITIEGDDGWQYIYVHLNNDSPGTDDGANPQAWIIPGRLRVGSEVTAGQVIGYLGDSGNAESTPPHLHFEIHRPDGAAINPTESAQRAYDDGRRVSVDSLASSADGRAQYLEPIADWYRASLGREPSEMEAFAWADRLDVGLATFDDLIADLAMDEGRRTEAGTVLRSYLVTVDRRPTLAQLVWWGDHVRQGADADEITNALIVSPEFEFRYGQMSEDQFIDQMFMNALGRSPGDDERQEWRDAFAEGQRWSTLTAHLADTYQVKDGTWHELEVIQVFRTALGREPSEDEFNKWTAHLDQGGLLVEVVDGIL